VTSSPDGCRPLVYGHRGASADARENTLDAFALARAQGADGVELDVRPSADASLVLHHDVALADGRLVHEVADADLPEWVPSLGDALDVCEGIVVNIEIKNSAAEPGHDPSCRVADDVVSLLQARGGRDAVLVSSFDLATIDRVRALDPTVPTAFLTLIEPVGEAAVALTADRGHAAIHPHEWSVDAEFVSLAHARGLEVNVWTVDDPERIRALAAAGVDGIVTNVPALALEALRAARG